MTAWKTAKLVTFFASGAALLLAVFPTPSQTKLVEYPTPTIREQEELVVDGKPEIWQLVWASAPKPACGANEVSISLTCPCFGFAYGEEGALVLLRLRNGKAIERKDLTAYFEGQENPAAGHSAVIQRWAVDHDRDSKAGLESNGDDITALVADRKIVQFMNFADYNHDGWASEFYVQTGTLPCGKSVGVIVGVSRRNPKLHVFGTASNPDKPLYLQRREWEALRGASSPIEVTDWQCQDHGAEAETAVRLRWTAAGIAGVRREYTCPEGTEPKRLIHEEPL